MTHTLTTTDLTCDLKDETHLLFRTESGARGYAARKGTLGGMLQYQLDGRRFIPTGDDLPHREETCGYELGGKRFLYAEAA